MVAATADDDWERQAGWLDEGLLTINQWRAKQGMSPVAWGDNPWAPLNKGQFGVEGSE